VDAASRAPSGSLRIVAVRRGGRTVVETLRQEGLARCSRPLAEPGAPQAARLVVSQLGPGFVRGDRFTTDGELGPGGQLTVAAQAAARVLGEGAASEALTTWRLGPGARLFIAGEPTMLYAGATNRSYSTVTLGAGASLAWIDAIAPYGAFERATTQLRVFYGDRLAVHDRLVLTPARLPAALGSAYYLRDGLSPERQAELLAAADAFAARACDAGQLRIGVGNSAAGGIALRAVGDRVRDVREALFEVLVALRRIDGDHDVPFV